MKSFIAISLLSFCVSAFAQTNNILYFDRNNKQVATRDSCYYVQVVEQPDSSSKLFKITDYYTSGGVKRVGLSSTLHPLTLEGSCITYHEDGRKMGIYVYSNNKIISNYFYHYYDNLKLKSVLYYPDSTYSEESLFDKSYLVMKYNALDGNSLVNNGSGYCNHEFKLRSTDDLIYTFFSEGKIEEGTKTGLWKCKSIKGNIKLSEFYEHGYLKSGTAVFPNGETSNYITRTTPAYFNAENKTFVEYLSSVINKPLRLADKSDKEAVVIYFKIDANGKLKQVEPVSREKKFKQSIELAKAAKKCPNWVPATLLGKNTTQTRFIEVIYL
jgi:hypothetical protein